MDAVLPENRSHSLQDDQKQQVHIPQQVTGQKAAGSNYKDTIPSPPLHDTPPEILPEILSEIFSLLIPTRKFVIDSESLVEERSDYKIKFAFSQVCKYWRAIALATPLIWSAIPVVSTGRLESEKYTAFTKMFIERSGSAPLHIAIIFPESHPRVGQEWIDFTTPLLDLICSHAYRWKSAIMHLHDDNAKIFQVLDYPILESLNYKRESLVFFQFFVDMRTIGHTPSLRHVILHGARIQLYLPWGHPYSTDLASVEQANPQLRTCVLIGTQSLQWYPSTVMVFSQLTSLKFINVHRTFERPIIPDNTTVLRCISTPVLENLEIRTTSNLNEAPTIVAELHCTMLSCPSITLRSISFHALGMTREDLKRLLNSTPCLTTLDINDAPASIFACLSVGTLSRFMEPLAPRLESLTIHDFSYSDVAALWDVHDSRHRTLNTAQDDMKVAPLDIIFSYSSFRACRQAQCRIAECDSVAIEALKKMLGWCDHLVKQFLDEFPQKERKYGVLPRNKESSRQMYSPKDLNVFFADVIEAQLFSDPIIIESSRINKILSDIRDLPPTAILDDNDYEFRKRAGRVLDSLAPLLEDLAQRRRWILGEDYLTLKACGPTSMYSREN